MANVVDHVPLAATQRVLQPRPGRRRRPGDLDQSLTDRAPQCRGQEVALVIGIDRPQVSRRRDDPEDPQRPIVTREPKPVRLTKY